MYVFLAKFPINEIIIMKQGKILVSGSRNNILKSVEEKIWECDDIEKNNHVIICNQKPAPKVFWNAFSC